MMELHAGKSLMILLSVLLQDTSVTDGHRPMTRTALTHNVAW